MRFALILLVMALAGCAAEDHAGHGAERWTFTQRSSAEDVAPIGDADGFALAARELVAGPNARQIGGQWHGPLAAGTAVTLRVNASIDMTLEWRAKAGEVAASGRCEWGAEGAEKEVAVGTARMSNTTRTCTLSFTPNVELRDPVEPSLRWEARSAQPEPRGWTLVVDAQR